MNKLVTFSLIGLMIISTASSFGESYSDDDAVEEFEDTFPILFMILTVLNFIVNSLCIIQTIRMGKFKKDAKYIFILNYFVLKTIHGITKCVSLLMSSKLTGSRFYIYPVQTMCQVTFFSTFYLESGEALLLTLIWFVLFSERNLLGFQSFYSDLNGTSTKNFRRTFLLIFYVGGAVIFGFLAAFTRPREYFSRTCMLDDTASIIIAIGFVCLFCPALFSLIQYSSIFWKVFGGPRDPIKAELTASARSFLKFIKIASILKVIEFFFLDIQSSQGFFYNSVITEVFRTFGLTVIFVTGVLYLYFESAIPFTQRSAPDFARADPMKASFVPQNSINSERTEEAIAHDFSSPY